jgi:membrane protein implicated in regulation of membrane protease activity
MRREGAVFLAVAMMSMLVLTQGALLLNTLALFLLAGVIPGTQVAFSSSVMLALTLTFLTILILWPMRQKIISAIQKRSQNTKQIEAVSRRRFKQIRL